VQVTVSDGTTTRTTTLPLLVSERNLAVSAHRMVAAVTEPTGSGARDLEVLRDETDKPAYDSYDGKSKTEDFYGYVWREPVKIGRVRVQMGPKFHNGGWFETVNVQYRDAEGAWMPVEDPRFDPPFNLERMQRGEFRFDVRFKPVTTRAIRVVGKPGGSAEFTSIAELSVHEK
jgi:hypothetical protein